MRKSDQMQRVFFYFNETEVFTTEKENKMGTMPVGKLLLTMGVPIILSMVLQAVYNIVDSAFVSNMTENGEEIVKSIKTDFIYSLSSSASLPLRW